MPRLPRHHQKSICYHIYNRGMNHQPVFVDDADRRHFTELALGYKLVCHARIYHWAWMENHYHLLVEVAFEHLRPLAGGLQQSYAQYHHARHHTCGAFWQGRYQSKPVETGDYLVRCGRYIERNPVRAGLVGNAWEYRWSSAAAYVRGLADVLTDANKHLSADGMTSRDRALYAEALRGGQDDDWMRVYAARSVIGSAAFARRLRRSHGRHRHKRGGVRVVRNRLQRVG